MVKKLLRAVPPKFLQITSVIEQFGDLETMTVEETIVSLKAHEERVRGQIEATGGQLLLTEEEWLRQEKTEGQLLLTSEKWARRSGKARTETFQTQRNRGNTSYAREGIRVRDKSRVRCFNCNAYGHFAAECRKPHRDREQKPEANMVHVQDEEPALLLAEREDKKWSELLLNEDDVVPKLSENNGKKIESNVWYLDNGASNHMTGQHSKFLELDEGITGRVKFGDGSTVDIKGKGTILFKCKNGEELVFHEVYYILTLQNNIISLGQVSECGNEVVLKGDYLRIFDKQQRLLMKVKRSNNRLYKIILESGGSKCLLTKMEELTWMWHSRLGHVNFQAMKLMFKDNMVYRLPQIIQPKEVCT